MPENLTIPLPDPLAALQPYATPIVRSAVILALGFFLAFVLSQLIVRPLSSRLSAQSRLIIRKAISYSLSLVVIIMILREFGFQLTTLLGAAGIAGIAIGFAAQTSLSNIISGIFLLFEKPFEVGDVIRLGEHTGFVESIDLLSLTLRTFDNISIRIPNETLVKGMLINVTRHPIRRYDIQIGISYDQDIDTVMAVLREVADENPHVLVEPEPLVALTGFGESQLSFLLGVWHEKDDFIEMRNSILRDLKARFDEDGIEIAYPHRVIIQRPETGSPLKAAAEGLPTEPGH
ncbi:MAG: Small-conductance mechanosensitive channel [Verrucomicrobia bacterium]|nr:MAG: Small-conductance mechanosensitive channel [Verrucomicrobiota bacterium]